MNEQVFTGSGATSFQTQAIDLDQKFGYSIQAAITGTITGTMNLQGSDDFGTIQPGGPDNGAPGVTNWSDITGSSTSIAGAGSAIWNAEGVFYKWVRVNYVATSGTGTITIRINTKGF